MSKKMLVNATQHEENRVAIVEDGILTELDIEVAGHEPTKGNIYRAVVVRVEPGLQAAFVDYGAGRLGFLQIDEINFKVVKPDYQPAEDGRRPKITDLIHRDQELLVQIIKEERGTKGAALTTYLSLAGRYMVIMPDSQTRGVSRKAENDERKDLKKAMSSFEMADNIGYIVRTAALNQTSEELQRDYNYLIRLYENILDLNKKVKAPALLYKESNLIIRSIRDYFTTDMEEVLIDDPQVFEEAKDFFQMVMPDHARLVKLHQERRPIFSRYQIEDQIETLNRNKVPLPSGGSIVIDPTEALVSIDVNSGKMASEQGVEATATKTNLEAAKEIGRQLRLRDLGGLVVIDFIDMRERKHAREVEHALKKSLQNDKARVSIGRISQFGLLEMSRQRLKATLAEGSYLICPHCQGSGKLKSPETQAASLLRKIHASAAKGQVQRIDAQLPLEVAAYLLNHKREELVEMERDHQLQIHIHGNRDFLSDQLEIEITKREKEKPQQEFVSAASIALPAPEPKAKEGEAPETQKAEETQAEPDKKRRRRRRRKPASQEVGATQETAPETADAADEETAEPVVGQTDEAAKEHSEAETAPTEKKPQRRRRSSSRSKKQAEQPQAEKPAEESTSVPFAEKTMEETSESKSEVLQDKPKHRSRRKPKTAPKEGVIDNVQSSPTAEQPVPTETSAPEELVKTEEKQPEKTQRARRSPKKVSTSEEVKEAAKDTGSQSAEEKPEAAKEAEEEKPKRRRAPRKTTRATEESSEAVVSEQTPGAEETGGPKTQAKRRDRKPATKKTTEAKQEETKESSAATTREQPKPKRRRPARKKTSGDTEAASEDS